MIDIRWAAMARRDMESIDGYHRAIDPALASEIIDRILRGTAILADLPRAGPAASRAGQRKWRIAGTPYLVFYRVAGDHVRILRVLHAAREIAGLQ